MSSKVPTLREIRTRYSPDANPLMESVTVPVVKRRVRSGLSQTPLVDGNSGELVAASVIQEFEDLDSDHFVKVFAAGIAAAYQLSKAGQRVFYSVLAEYERADMSGGFAACVALAWFDGGLSGRDIGMSEKTFNRGLRELLDKGFIAPRTVGLFWVNPSLFFKGDRVLFVKEYRRAARVVARPPVAAITGTSHVVAPDDGASRPRHPTPESKPESREPAKPQHAPVKPVQPVNGHRFGKKKRKAR